ncbi:hypothetical protein BLNAU_9672 [Blattamonas nauphoetae]|uniref:Uncharacterized protein n=1 Tax=Blattamonas nauphoetae TaxID=2049346 RepID=A0ABQ9XVD3_9EUKA|nr:hypothetical protein BLNAU_9672 [Blattamonas nauphoetae]
MYLTHFPDESAAIRICHADTVMFFLRSIVDQLVVLSNGNSSVEIIGTILSRETDEREDMDIEERMRADGRVNLDKPIQTPSPIFYAPLQCLKRVESHSVIYAAVEQRHCFCNILCRSRLFSDMTSSDKPSSHSKLVELSLAQPSLHPFATEPAVSPWCHGIASSCGWPDHHYWHSRLLYASIPPVELLNC